MVEIDLAEHRKRKLNRTQTMLNLLGKTIVSGGYEGVPFPTEEELSKTHGVSRSVTREAVKMLTAKGLVNARTRQGTTVQPPSHWNMFDADVLRWLLDREPSLELLRHFNQLRIAIEPEAAALAAIHHTDAQMLLIEAGLARMADAETGADDPLASDIAFHVSILHATRNPFYEQFEPMVATALRTSIRFTNAIKGHSASLCDHGAVAQAVADRDPAMAREAMRKIIGDVLELIDDGTA
ncbi:FadR/GntR family transcriptional regulator [Novosphingobium album (ex Hu et al. 2023)]|uniref:FadR family transcriptional regulator n=1 Tax=Novosphingobium album (ex Hu et al. 2023) TaxID=2930093 RepID=A0ABT0B5C1_9SPHN|nr:FadR/GntR family transcriptional regulator [Novosphingobium album (ex Hu et al. 2023)]MCJ2180235.1 FadR family transcriptional regulator [Novosphingobium album (ex Hu et al. 2023)]